MLQHVVKRVLELGPGCNDVGAASGVADVVGVIPGARLQSEWYDYWYSRRVVPSRAPNCLHPHSLTTYCVCVYLSVYTGVLKAVAMLGPSGRRSFYGAEESV